MILHDPLTGREMSSSAAPDPPFQNLARQANKLMDQLQKGYYNFCSDETWTPSVNLYETAHTYLVCVDLAGVEKAKIDLEVSDGRLKLKGSRPVPTFEGADAFPSLMRHIVFFGVSGYWTTDRTVPSLETFVSPVNPPG